MIKLRKLKLKNFLSHTKTEIHFDDEAYVILGENASGKTSILRGIFFGIFGEDLKKSKLEKLINRKSNYGEVEITFIHRGNEYTILREISVKRNSATLLKNGKLEAATIKQVKEAVRDSLGLSPDIFKNTVFVPQGEIVELLKGSPSDRRKVLNRLLGLNEFEKKHELLKAERKKLENFRKHLEILITGIEKDLEEKEKAERRIQILDDEIKKLSCTIEEEEVKVKKAQEELNKLEEKKNIYTQITTKLNNLERNIRENQERLKKNLLKLDEIKEKKEEILKLREAVKPLKGAEKLSEIVQELKLLCKEAETLKQLLKEKQKLLIEKKSLEEKIPILEEELEKVLQEEFFLSQKKSSLKEKIENLTKLREKYTELKSEIESKKKQLLRLQKEIPEIDPIQFKKLKIILEEKKEVAKSLEEKLISIENLKEELLNRLNLLKKNGSKCPVCNSKLTEDKKKGLIENVQQEIKKLIAEEQTTVEKAQKLKKEIKELENKLRFQENLIVKKETLESEKSKLKKEIENLSSKIPEFNEDGFKELENSLNIIEKREFEIIKKKTELMQKIQNLKETIKDKPKEEEINKINAELTSIESRISELKAKAKELKETYKLPVSNGKELAIYLKELKEKENRLKRLEGEVSSEKELQREIQELREELTKLKKEKLLLEENLKKLSFDEELYRSFKETSTALISQFQEKKEKLSRLKGERVGLKENLNRLRKKIEEAKKTKENFLKVRQAVNLLTEMEKSIHPGEGFLKFVRTSLLPQIAYYCKEFFSSFDFEFGDLYIDENLTVTFGIPGQGTMSLDELSGGQQIAFALALRFAMARNFSQRMELLVLDEPTVHLDAQRRMGLTELLSVLKTKLPQMLIVTHDPELEVVGDKVIRVKNYGGDSRVEIGS